MLENISLRKKLWLPSMVGAAALLVLFGLSAWLSGHVDTQLEELERDHISKVAFFHELEDLLLQIQLGLREAVARDDKDSIRATDALRDRLLSQIHAVKDNPVHESAQLNAMAERFETYHASAVTASLEMLVGRENDREATQHADAVREQYIGLQNQLETGGAAAKERMLAIFDEVRASHARLTKAHGAVLIFCVALLAMVSRAMVSDTTSMVERLRASASRVASGELQEEDLVFDESEHTRSDELGALVRSFSAMRFNLRVLVAGAGNAAHSVTGGAHRLAEFHKELALVDSTQDQTLTTIDEAVAGITKSIDSIGGTMDAVSDIAIENSRSIEVLEASAIEAAAALDSQLDSVDQVATSTAEMGLSIKAIAENAQFLIHSATETSVAVEQLGRATEEVSSRAEDTARVASEFNERSQIGQRKAAAVGKSAKQVQSASGQLVELMNTLSTRLQVVGQINSVIQDIVDETTLLSLNARIVSAQAGSQGKSFAVVAEAIKELASRAGKSTDEIRSALTLIQQDAGLAAAAVEANVEAVEDSALLSTELASELDRIGEGATRCLENMSEISAACTQQSQGLSEVRNAVKQVSRIADQVEFGTTEQASATASVHKAVEEMLGFIEQMRQSAGNQRMSATGIGLGATELASRVDEVGRAMDETRQRGEQIRDGLQLFAALRDEGRNASDVVADEVKELVGKSKQLSGQLENFRL